ncbi:hypothetical protein ACVW00_001070 [Marmoricola sp. URHA0025 HA25]
MLSLTVHAILGVVVVWLVLRSNPEIFRRPASGPLLSSLEIGLYAVGLVSIGIGWYFNVRFVTENTDGWLTNPFVGDGSWQQYVGLLFDNPAAGSASGDFITANVVLLPLISIVGGRRLGINRPWLFFVVTLFASFSAGWAFYAATVERQRRLRAERTSLPAGEHA